MNSLAAIVRSLFGTQALLITLAIGMDLVYLTRELMNTGSLGESEGIRESPVLFLVVLALFGLGAAALHGVAWWMLRNGKPGVRVTTFWVSLVSLAIPPVGFILGVLGLILCTKPHAFEQARVDGSAPGRVRGDGTHPWGNSIACAAQVVFLMAAAHLWNQWRTAHHLPMGELFADLLLLEVALILNTFLHEAGHVLAGWSNGMSLANFSVGPFLWKMEEGRRRFHFQLAGLIGGGHAGLVPHHLNNLRRRFLWITMAGPAASLLTAILATALALTAPGSPWESWWNFLSMLSTLAILGSVFNLIPVRPQDQYSDGAQIVQLLRNGPWADVHQARAMVSSSLVTSLRPAEFDEALLKRSADFVQSGLVGLLMRIYLTIHYVDKGAWNEARAYLESAEALYPQVANTLPAELCAEFVVLSTVLDRDPAATRWWWQQTESKKGRRKELDYWLAHTAWLYAEGQFAAAWATFAKAEQFVQRLPRAGAYEFDRVRLTLLRSRLEAVAPGYGIIPAAQTSAAGYESYSGIMAAE